MADKTSAKTYEDFYGSLPTTAADYIDSILDSITGTTDAELIAAAVAALRDKFANDNAVLNAIRPYIIEQASPKQSNFVYTPEAIAGLMGYTGDGQVEQMLRDWGDRDKMRYYRDVIDNTQGITWDNVYKAMSTALNDKAARDVVEGRRRIMEGEDGVTDWLASAVMGLFAPRVKEDIIANGDWSAKDALLDATEDLAMTVPGAAFVRAPATALRVAGKLPKLQGLAQVPGKVATYLRGVDKGLGTGLLGDATRSAAQFATNLAGNAVVPTATELLDAAAYDDNDMMDDRADVSVGDILTGTLVNQLVNRGLLRSLAPEADAITGNISSRGSSGKLRQVLSDLGSDMAAPGRDYVNAARDIVDNAHVKSPNTMATSAYNGARKGDMVAHNVVDEAEYDQAQRIAAIADAIDNGSIKLRTTGKDAKRAAKADKANRVAERNGIDPFMDNVAVSDETKAAQTARQQRDDLYELADAIDEENMIYNGGIPSDGYLDRATKTIHNSAKDKMDDAKYIHKAGSLTPKQIYNSTLIPGVADDELTALLLDPHMINYATWNGPRRSATKAEYVLRGLNMAVPSFTLNRLGKEDYTKSALDAVDKTGKLQEERKETHEAPKARRVKQKADDILMQVTTDYTDDLTEEDKGYLRQIQADPGVLKYSTDSRFKNWLLVRGQDLLRDTGYFRPAFRTE